MSKTDTRLNVLFVCSRNKWRSPTAEQLYRRDSRMNVRSRGTSKNAVRVLTGNDLHWADVIMVMEQSHQKQIVSKFRDEFAGATIHVLDIPDDYQYMDPELIEMIGSAVEPIVTGA